MPRDPSAVVASTARVHPDAVIGAAVHIGEYCVIESDVVVGAGCRLEPYVYIKRWTTLGDDNQVSAATVLGTDPLDKAFTGERSYLRIGHRNRIREHFTISRGTEPESATEIGDDNYIMTSGHIAHNCKIGDQTVIASCALLAGYVEVEDQVFISGGLAIHQFTRVGRLAMIGGMTRVNQDVPPFVTCVGEQNRPHGVNVVGMRRAGFGAEQVRAIRQAYRLLYRSGLRLEEALGRIEAEISTPETQHMVRFIRASRRGIARERIPVLK